MEDYRDKTPQSAPLVRVDWEDICFADSWNDDDGEELQPVEASIIGYLLLDTASMLVVASSYNWRDGSWGTVHTIPKMPPTVRLVTGEKDG